ncbi:MAG TPA: thiamine phosphate synthase [Actinomycetota bacterium]|nr:thiamine phosphate synthase [Actinomycetota bacterium]
MDPRSLRAYVLTSTGFVPGRGHADVAAAAIAGGASAVQLRAPELDDVRLCELAARIAARCRAADVLFVLNDRPAVAARIGAGAHVGQDDDPASAREAIGPDAALGVSVSTPEEALAAERDHADYLAVTVWATATKPEASPRGLDGLRAVVATTMLPVVGIGGIHAGNAHEVLDAGAAGVCVVSAVGAAPDPERATRELVDAVNTWEARRE